MWWPDGRPHPGWCDGNHLDEDAPDDRSCWGPSWDVDLSLPSAHPDDATGEDYLHLDVTQYLDDLAARIWLGEGETRRVRQFTPAEARKLAAALIEAADAAEEV